MSDGERVFGPDSLDPNAKDIVEALLAQTGNAILTNDFALAAPCFKLPQSIHIFDNGVNIDTIDDLRKLFDGVRDYYTSLGVTEVIRPCHKAVFHDDDTIYAHHMTYLLADGVKVIKPYPVFSIVEREGGDWKFAHAVYAVTDDMPSADWAYRYLKRPNAEG